MTQPFVAPKVGLKGFNCPSCNAYSEHRWYSLYSLLQGSHPLDEWSKDVNFGLCSHCDEASIWLADSMIWPRAISAPMSHSDMPPDIAIDYEEARNVLASSPRSAAALLRLCVQKLCVELGEPGKNINADIGGLVAKGLSPKMQQALDIVRVVGNEQVHPGTLDVRDNPEIAAKLFAIVNFIVEDQITKPKLIDELYQKIPTEKLKGIQERDKPKP